MTPPLDLLLPADVHELATGRAAVRQWLGAQGLDAVAAADLLAVASEFLLHAIVRSGGVGSVRLVGERHARGVRLAVTAGATAGAGAPHPLGLPADPLVTGGFGRRLVETCCDDLAITTGADGAARAECWRRSA